MARWTLTARGLPQCVLSVWMLSLVVAGEPIQPEVVYEWTWMNYSLPSGGNGSYIPKNCPLTGIKVYHGTVYVTTPRWREGVPATLSRVSGKGTLEPYPSHRMQTLGDCDSLQLVQSMEVDPLGRMWIVDTGRSFVDEGPGVRPCQPRILVWDVGGNRTLRIHRFPNSVVSKTSYLNDVVVDLSRGSDDAFAYITDSREGAIVVYGYAQDRSWKVEHESMKASMDLEAREIQIDGVSIQLRSAVNGIALSPSNEEDFRVYYSPLTSFNLYSVPAWVLREAKDAGPHVTDHGTKPSQSDGMMMSSENVLYFAGLGTNAVYAWNASGEWEQELVAKDDRTMQWVDTFAMRGGYLWFTSNRMQLYREGKTKGDEVNFRVLRVRVPGRSYMGEEEVEDSAVATRFSSLLTVLVAFFTMRWDC